MTIQALMQNKTTPAFKGSYDTTDKGVPYYKTNNALKVGAVYGGIGALGSLFPGESKIGGLIGLGLHSAIGAFLDYKRNQKAAEAAEYIKTAGAKQALATREDIYISSVNGRPYYHSNVGAKYGTAIGAGIGAIIGILPSSVITAAGLGKAKDKELATAGVLSFAIITGITTLGGFILGKISDYFTNKAAERNA